MEQEIKELRVKIDGLVQLIKSLKEEHNKESKYPFNSPECSKGYDSLILAKAWLGKMLQEIGTLSPYKSGYRTKEDIVSTAEVAKNLTVDVDGGWQEMNHIERVDYLRTEIQYLIDNTTDFSEDADYIELEQGFVYKYLCEARFWLGFELQRIKEEK